MANLKTNREDAALMRLLLGEICPEEKGRLEHRLAGDTALRGRLEQLRKTWDSLEMAPAPALPESFRGEILAAVREQGAGAREISWAEVPAWARAAAGLTLVLGMVLGLGVGHSPPAIISEAELEAYFTTELESAPLSLAESYWLALEEQSEALWHESAEDSAVEEEP